jgi:hypothetical protein
MGNWEIIAWYKEAYFKIHLKLRQRAQKQDFKIKWVWGWKINKKAK